MLPGDWLAYQMTGEICTTPSGLSEGVLWDFAKGGVADLVLDWYGIPRHMVPDVRPTFSVQGALTEKAAQELGLKKGVPVSYRAGDQPEQCVLAERPGPRGGRDHRGHLGRGLRRCKRTFLGPALPREHVCPREPLARDATVRRPPLPERHGDPQQVDEADPLWR